MLSEVERTVEQIIDKVPSAVDHLTMTLEYDLSQSTHSGDALQHIEALALQIRNKYNNIMRFVEIVLVFS